MASTVAAVDATVPHLRLEGLPLTSISLHFSPDFSV